MTLRFPVLAACAAAALGGASCGSDAGSIADPLAPSNVPVVVTGLSGAVAIAPGRGHTCAVLASGAARCWGWNLFGQLGNGMSGDFKTVPVAVAGLIDATAISAGDEHTCALHRDGTVSCWGKNEFGQVGDGTAGTTMFRTTPVKVAGLSGVTAIAAGGYTSCALVAGGAVRCWGLNTFGQLGEGSAGGSRSSPVAVAGVSGAKRLSVGSSHACVVTAGDGASCWGLNNAGQLGDRTTTDRPAPVAVAAVAGVTAITAGGGHTCVTESAKLFCVGNNLSGQLGAGTTASQSTAILEVMGVSGVVSSSSGSAHGCAVLSDKTARCWGANPDGQLGSGGFETSYAPVAVRNLTNATLVAAGSGHTCAILADQTARCWGRNSYGQLGHGRAR